MPSPKQSQHRFSARTAWDRSASELEDPCPETAAHLLLLDLTSSNPTDCGLHLDASSTLEPLLNQEARHYRPDSRGLLSARKAIAGYYAGHQAIVSPEQIILTASTSEAYSHLFRLLCDAGDEVLIAQPSYPLFQYLADLSDVTLRFYPLFYDYGWWIDFAELERSIGPRTRAIIVVHPNNPTGHLTSSEEQSVLFELCRRHGLSLIVDEVFLDYPHGHVRNVRSFAACEALPLTFVLSGMSKIAALPQMKVGWLLALGPDAEREEALLRLELIADTFLSVSAPSQLAVPRWLQEAAPLQRQIRERVEQNVSLLRNARLEIFDVVAGWSVILRLPRIFGAKSAFETLRELGIRSHPAHFFGLQDANKVVLSLLVPTEVMGEAVARIAAHLRLS